MSDIEIYNALPKFEREKLGFTKWRELSRIGTHGTDCYRWGHAHYACALAEIARLNGERKA